MSSENKLVRCSFMFILIRHWSWFVPDLYNKESIEQVRVRLMTRPLVQCIRRQATWWFRFLAATIEIRKAVFYSRFPLRLTLFQQNTGSFAALWPHGTYIYGICSFSLVWHFTLILFTPFHWVTEVGPTQDSHFVSSRRCVPRIREQTQRLRSNNQWERHTSCDVTCECNPRHVASNTTSDGISWTASFHCSWHAASTTTTNAADIQLDAEYVHQFVEMWPLTELQLVPRHRHVALLISSRAQCSTLPPTDQKTTIVIIEIKSKLTDDQTVRHILYRRRYRTACLRCKTIKQLMHTSCKACTRVIKLQF